MKNLTYLLILLFALQSCSTNRNTGDYKVSDHYDGNKFFNPNGTGPAGFIKFMKWQLSFNAESWPSKLDNPPPPFKPKTKVTDKMSVTFINHATFLIQVNGLNILTDPVYSDRSSPVSFLGPKAIHPPGILFDELPPIDFVLISHNHYDHMDSETVRRLEEKFNPHFVTPIANASLLKEFGAKKITELDWWESFEPVEKLKITLTPAQHWSSRTPFDRMKSLWGGFFINSTDQSVFFCGDTGYSNHFKDIRRKLGAPKVSILPIGAYEPRWFMKEMHMNPEDAVLAHLDLESQFSIGMHFGTFKLTDEAFDTPAKDLMMAAEKHKTTNFKAPYPGENFSF